MSSGEGRTIRHYTTGTRFAAGSPARSAGAVSEWSGSETRQALPDHEARILAHAQRIQAILAADRIARMCCGQRMWQHTAEGFIRCYVCGSKRDIPAIKEER